MAGDIEDIRIETRAHEGKVSHIQVSRASGKVRSYQSDLARSRIQEIVEGRAPDLIMEVLVLPWSIIIDIWRENV
jgi:hypothetical protein